MENWHERRLLGEVVNVGWSRDKAARNRAKHGVTFEEAAAVLDDPAALNEPEWAGEEERDRFIGRGSAGRVLVVIVFIAPPGGGGGAEEIGFIRVISARRATPSEEAQYRR